MSEEKKKRHIRELIAVLCAAAVIGAGVWYLKDQSDKRETAGNASSVVVENAQSKKSSTAADVSGTETEQENDEENTTAAEKAEPVPSQESEKTQSDISPEEKLSGVYHGISWAGTVGGQIIACQMDAIEVKDAAGQTVRTFADLGRLSLGSDAVYTNGCYAWYAAAADDGTRGVWQLDLETGEKKKMFSLGERETFTGVNSEYLYYIVPGADEFENTLKALRISDGMVLDIAENVDEVTVLPESVIAMGLRFDVSPAEMKVCSPDGSSQVTVGEYVNCYQVDGDRIYYLDYGDSDGYMPSDLKSCSPYGQDVQVLAQDLYTISFSAVGQDTVYFASEESREESSESEYVLLNYRTGERKTVAEGGSYIQYLCSDQNRVYLGKDDQIVVYDMAGGQMKENVYTVPEGSYVTAGFLLEGKLFSVQESSDNRIETVAVEGL